MKGKPKIVLSKQKATRHSKELWCINAIEWPRKSLYFFFLVFDESADTWLSPIKRFCKRNWWLILKSLRKWIISWKDKRKSGLENVRLNWNEVKNWSL